jgi:hypothetical protein
VEAVVGNRNEEEWSQFPLSINGHEFHQAIFLTNISLSGFGNIYTLLHLSDWGMGMVYTSTRILPYFHGFIEYLPLQINILLSKLAWITQFECSICGLIVLLSKFISCHIFHILQTVTLELTTSYFNNFKLLNFSETKYPHL